DGRAFLVGAGRRPQQVRALLDRLAEAGVGSEPAMRGVLSLARGLRRASSSLPAMIDAGSSQRIAAMLAEAAELARSNAAIEHRLGAIRLLALGQPHATRPRPPPPP